MSDLPNGYKYKNSRKRGRGGKWRRAPATEQNTAPSTLLFETFEARLLLDAVLPINSVTNSNPPNGTVLASDTQPGVVQDTDGTMAGVTITGNGHWQIVQESLAPALTVTGTDSNSTISITTTGGDNQFLFSSIDVEGSAASLTGTGVELNGGLTLNGTIGNLLLGDLTVDASSALTVAAKSTDTTGALTIGESTIANLTVNGGATLSSAASIIGDQTGSGGSTVTVSGTGSLWQVNGGLTVGNNDSGSQLSVNAKGTVVLDSLDVGAETLGGGTVSVSGTGSKLSVSGAATFGDLGNGILSMQSGAVVTLGSATFGDQPGSLGQVTLTGKGTTLNVVGTLVLGGAGTAVMTLGAGTSLNASNLVIGSGGVLTTAGGSIGGYTATVGPALTAGLTSFASGSATNGTTANPTVTGTISAANTLVSLRAGLGAAALTSYTDITGTISNGAFTVTQAELTALNGGTLPDGRYVLNLIATDQLGIQTTVTVTITLQTVAPTVQGFGLSQSSAVGGAGTVTADSLVALTGTTTPGASVMLVGVAGMQTLAGSNGVFQFANVPVAEGANPFTVQVTNGLGLSSQAQTTVTRQGAASTDVSMQWDQVVLNTITSLAMYPPDASRLLAIVSLAQYDTLAAIEGTPAYMVQMSVTGPVSEQAALAETAYEVLVDLFPALKANYDAALATSLQGIASGTALTAGLALGKTIADTIVAIRSTDGSANFVQYDGGDAVGQWQPTAPIDQPAIDPQWGSVTPFAISSADALVQQLGPPPALSSAQWATDLNQVESLGSATSTTRTADQTQIAQFWSAGTGTPTPAGLWNTIAQTVSQQQGLSLSANVRMFAILNTAMADAAIADWDVKYTNGTWRPIQAIPVANTVNSAAISDPGFTPLLITPAFPEYAAGHATFSSAGAVVLASIFGDNTSFSFSVTNLPGIVRSFTSFSQAATEAGMSRIYGGIHFMFSITAGWQLGTLVGQQVLARFAQTADTEPPVVLANATPAATNTNVTLAGQVVDNLSGVAGATISIDGGAPVALTLDATGHFSYTTTLRLDGSAEGSHSISIVATDIAGNVANPFVRAFVLDTLAPVISVTSLNNGDNLTGASTLTGTAYGNGSSIVALSYTIDGGVVNPIAFDPTTGAFTQALPVANLPIGSHTITVTTQNAAGNVTTLTRTANVAVLAAFTISTITPTNGQVDVGTTQRPQITFSRAVNPATLTSASFYATDASGNVLPAVIAPSQDGSYAYLLFSNPMAGSSMITLHVVGSLIRAAADGAFLDAAGTGTSGSTLAETFTTVSTTGISGTTIEGIVADPGPDDVPMTFDDTGRGPDGILNTPDDVYKLPIAGVTVTILGTTLTAVTNSKGYFEIDNAPAGDVKLVVDGTTATSPPAGYYFPTMTLDLTLAAGKVNTPMSSMGTTEEMASNTGILGTFLPRVQSAVLTTVSTTQPTTVTTTTTASQSLTPSQVGNLSLTIQPGSALDASGNPVSSFQVGIAAVPPQIVQDMLPVGVTQHTFDITIQAPGVAVFTAPAQITFPNVFGAAPGTQLQVLSFDHTTGRLVIDGYATVSADGQTVTSNPGQGVTAPGWHGLVPPGTQNDPPCDPTVAPTIDVPPVPVTNGLQNYYFTQDGQNLTLSFGNAATPLDPSQDPCSDTNMMATPLDVDITVDDTASQFLTGLASESFSLAPGQQTNIDVDEIDLLTPAMLSAATTNTLYGTTVHIEAYQDGDPGNLLINQNIYIYRLLDVGDDNHSDGELDFAKTLDTGEVTQNAPLAIEGASGTMLMTNGDPFDYDAGTENATFQPTSSGTQGGGLQIMTPDGDVAGTIDLSGTGVDPQAVDFSKAAFTAAVKGVVDGGLILINQASVTATGTGYTAGTYPIVFTGGGGGTGAAGTYTVDATGGVTAITITATGSGYKTVPILTFPSGGGMGATGQIGNDFQFLGLFSPAPGPGMKPSDAADFQTNVDAIYNGAKAGILADYATVPGLPADALNVQDSTASPGISIVWGTALTGPGAFAQWADFGGTTFDKIDTPAYIAKTSLLQQEFDFNNITNRAPSDNTTFNLGLLISEDYTSAYTLATYAVQLGNVMTHEIGHDLGSIHERDAANAYIAGSVMGYDANNFTTATFGAHFNGLIDDALGVPLSSDAVYTATYNYYVTYVDLENIATSPRPGSQSSYTFNDAAYPATPDGPSDPDGNPDHGQNSTDPIYSQAVVFGSAANGTQSSTEVSDLDFGSTTTNTAVTKTVYLVSAGNEPLTVNNVSISGSSSAFHVTGFSGGPVVLPEADDDPSDPGLSTIVLTITYDPTSVGADAATLVIQSDSDGGVINIPLTGKSLSNSGTITLAAANDNLGGALVGKTVSVTSFGQVTNTGGQNLTITGVQSSAVDFTVTGLPANLSVANPIVLTPGQSFTYGVTFTPSAAGLIRGQILFTSNDPQHPTFGQTVDGTGTVANAANLVFAHDYVVVDFPNNPGQTPLRAISDSMGAFTFVLPPLTAIHYSIFDPVSGLIASGYTTTAAAGKTTYFPGLVFKASTANDGNGDGLPDDIKFAIGASTVKADSNGDGVDDFTALKLGLNPVSGVGFPTGIVSAANLAGTAQAVAIIGSTTNATQLTALVATGTAGLATVDVSNPNQPAVLAQLDLSGNNIGVAYDATTGLAAVAGSDAGLHIVDVSTPSTPTLVADVQFPDPVIAVAVSEGVAYVAEGTSVATVDLATDSVIATLDFSTTGGTTLTDLALSGTTLFTLDANHVLQAVSINGDLLTARGSLVLAASSGELTVGDGVVYVPAANGNTSGGYSTVNVSNLDALSLIAGVQGSSIADAAMALNGSGLAVAVQALQQPPPNPGVRNDLDVINISNAANTNGFVTRIYLPDAANGLAIANGLAFVADGSGGLQIVNYIGLDTKGVAPAVAINTNAIDVDNSTPGVQVVEGSVVQITPTVSDDVQIRNVELLVNGTVVANDPSFPFDFSVQVPTLANGGSTMVIQALAFDTGGNSTLSNIVTLNVVKDTFPPVVVATSVTENASLFYVKSLQITFNKPLDTSKLAGSGITLVNAGPDGMIGTADDTTVPVTFTTRSFGQVLTVLLSSPLPAGTFELRINPSIIVDLSGNVLTTPISLDFTIRPASNVNAATGVPAVTQEPSANPGQSIGIAVPFDPATAHMIFTVINTSGVQSTVDVAATQADETSDTAYFQVPYNAVTGNAIVYGLVGTTKTNFTDGTFPLEIVPVVKSITVNSVASDGSSANVTLHGLGFIPGNDTMYNFGTTTVTATSVSSGPNVFQTSVADDSVTLTVPLSAGAFGAITVTSGGGTSSPFTTTISSITDLGLSGQPSVAASGTPAVVGVASANPGQAVALTGAGLSTSTGLVMTYTDSGGTARTILLHPAAAALNGNSATVIVPTYFNGVATLSILGSSTVLQLQIVPTLTGYSISSVAAIYLYGSGLVEGSAANPITYNFSGGTVTDNSASTGPDVQNGGTDNGQVYLPNEAVHGFGTVTTTTPGGTSAPLTLNELQVGVGLIRSIAYDPSQPGQIWVADNNNPAALHLISTVTGQPVAATSSQVNRIAATTIASATNSIGTTSFFGAIQIVPQDMQLGFTDVPPGSLLAFYGTSNPDYVVALDPTSGTVIASLQLAGNFDTTAGVYDPVTGDLFVINRNVSPNQITAINPVDGSVDPTYTFTAPFNAGDGALALDPSGNGTLWYGSDQSNTIVQLSNTGTILRQISIGLQTPGTVGVSGLVFDASGNLLVATNQGNILKLNVNYNASSLTPQPTLTAITATATNGTPKTNAASADAGQVITLTGSNFGAGTQVQFQVRDGSGNVSTVAVAPLTINQAGTSLQVEVPTLATTGNIQVVNIADTNLGFSSYPDAIYRGMTVQVTPNAQGNAAINFVDGGTEGLSNESWGLDNVSVSVGATAVFSDNFESGTANAAWSQNTVDTSTPGVFTDFLGRFSSGGDTLNLTGLTSGQTYTLKFDFYALDSLDGETTSAGPDEVGVTVNGQQANITYGGQTVSYLEPANYALTEPQNFNGSALLPLQIVPVLTSMDGSPSGDGTFNLFGSGLQAGAMTITVGGVALADGQFANQYQNQILNGANGQDRIVAPLVLDGPVTVSTAGGSSTLPGYVFATQPTVQYTGLVASAGSGTPANGNVASANVGQTITLTGQGFTNSTYVLFSAQDATGANGQVVRTGTAGNNGTTLTVTVPELAKTGTVQVLGSAASYQLQIVPIIRSVGGAVATGNTIEIEATGVPPGEATVSIDGRLVAATVKDTVDVNEYSASNAIAGQQILTLTVPSAIGPGVITVLTNGGSAILQTGVNIGSQTPVVATGDNGDTIATATVVTLPEDSAASVQGTIGDGPNGASDVDMYAITGNAGDIVSLTLNSASYSHVRVFNAAGTDLVPIGNGYVTLNNTATVVTLTLPGTGTFYVGISGYYNTGYSPTVSGSGTSSYTGAYTLGISRQAASDTRLSSISTTATSGTAAIAGVASANIGQTITLNGAGFLSTDQVVFTGLDDNGDLYGIAVTPASVATNGTSLTVVVPLNATTGTVRLARESAGILLQIVPTLTAVVSTVGGVYNGGSGALTGTGFAEGLTTVNIGAAKLVDTARDSSGLDVYSSGQTLGFTVPTGVATGPYSVTTIGGTSATLGVSFTGITATSTSGTATLGGQALANPGQAITIAGTALSPSTEVVFQTVDDSGNKGQVIIQPIAVNAGGTSATLIVPSNAVTGVVRVVGDMTGGAVPLQIVPTITGMTVNSVSSDGTSASVTLHGTGFVEANNSIYQFGATAVDDATASQGPDVYGSGANVNLTVPLFNGSFGPITVTTAGGVSATLSSASISAITDLGLSGQPSVAFSGTPANAAIASANPGQSVTLLGSGLSTSTVLIMTYTSSNGTNYTVTLNPASAALNGTSATFVVPNYFNGVSSLRVLGSSTSLTLQIVPTLTGYSISSTDSIYLYGSGLEEGSAANPVSYHFAGGLVTDTSASAGPDVQVDGPDNAQVYLPNEPVHGFGTVTTTTQGGTSAPFTLNEMQTGDGLLRSLAFNAANPTQIWVADNANPALLHLIDTTTGADIRDINVTKISNVTNDSGATTFFGGLQVVPSAFKLLGANVPAGDLLAFYGTSNPDYAVAINPTGTGTAVGSLSLVGVATPATPLNFDTTAGVYDPVTGDLFVINRNVSPNQIVALFPTTTTGVNAHQAGTEDAAHTFNAPFNAGDGALALDPSGNGTLWYGSDQSTTIVQLSNTGTILRQISIGLQVGGTVGVSGLAFDASGNLLVATNQGNVLRLNVNDDAASLTPQPTLTSITAAATNGTAANPSAPAADAGQIITLTGSNFGAGTQVQFQVRDGSGNVSTVAVAPLTINQAGTSLQVEVPTLATTGNIQVVNIADTNLGFSSYPDAIYRGMTVQVTPNAQGNATISFADGGTEGLSNESWGLDNVSVSLGVTTVFSDNFESGTASAAWSQSTVDISTPAIFSDFLGRFSSGGDTLNLTGLTSGQTYTLKFDFYALDSLDGEITSAGPDEVGVTVNGQQANITYGGQTVPYLEPANDALTEPQNFNGSALLPLQIVPVLSSMDGSPNGDGTFNLFGSGLQAGGTTITVGGVTLADAQFANQYQNQILSGANGQDRIVAPLVLDGPVTVTTAGGSSTLAGYNFVGTQGVTFSGLVASAGSGTPANGNVASANVGQTITLTGQGFTNSTLVRFSAEDQSGVSGTVTRTGTASNNGTTLTITVPELAKTGTVTVLGTGTSIALQVVPIIRSVGGTVAAGNTIELETTGLTPAQLTVTIDGVAATVVSLRDTVEVNEYSTSNPIAGQQILTLTVPAGVSAGVISITTPGGGALYHANAELGSQTPVTATSDGGDTIATATAVTLPEDSAASIQATIGDGPNGTSDVDMYAITGNAGDIVSLSLNSASYSHVRVFNAAGTDLVPIGNGYVSPGSAATVVTLKLPSSGTFYVGVSGYYNTGYNPTVSGSGTSSYTGAYTLGISLQAASDTRLSSISTTAASGTAAIAGVASANTGQTITLNGAGMNSGDQVVFTGLDDNGDLYGITVTPASVAPDGTSLTVVVPLSATTGTVRLARESAGILLQIVPTLTAVNANVSSVYNSGGETLSGTGFAEGLTTVNIGAAKLVDTARDSSGLDVYSSGQTLGLTVPNGVATGPYSVTTIGGTSTIFGVSFTGITATPTSGTAANGAEAAANPGQQITLTGTNLSTSTEVVFQIVDDSGNKSQIIVHPVAPTTSTSATVVVPANAVTGVVRVVGDMTGDAVPLQIVPTITGIIVSSVSADGTSASITLHGTGFVEGNNSSYQFGATSVADATSSQGPDVYSSGTSVNLTVPIVAGTYGPITVTTAGGVSAQFGSSLTLTVANATATSGTPANAALPSANPGQTITLTGTGLTTSTGIIFSYTPSGGGVSYQLVNPATANGTSATFVVPTYANGVTTLAVLGASNPVTLQVVPVITSGSVAGQDVVRLFGLGFQEGSAGNAVSYNFAGGSVLDNSASAGPDVYNNNPDNSGVYLPAEPSHGFGAVTMTTAGGTSAPLTLNEMQTGDGYLRDVAMDPANPGQLWVADNGNPAKLHLLNIATGADIRDISLASGFGSSAYFGGMQIVPVTPSGQTPLTLNGVAIPAGSILLFDGQNNPDNIYAINPTNGAILASLTLTKNYDLTGGVYNPFNGDLYVIDRSVGPNQIVAINPATGAEIANSRFNLPFNAGEAGLALDPSGDGSFWYGSDQSNSVVHLSVNGSVIKTDDLSTQGVSGGTNGLSFDNSGNLLVASQYGVVYRVTV